MSSVSRKQLRSELSTIENLMQRYGGDISLWTAQDKIAISLDFYRGAGSRHTRNQKQKPKIGLSISMTNRTL